MDLFGHFWLNGCCSNLRIRPWLSKHQLFFDKINNWIGGKEILFRHHASSYSALHRNMDVFSHFWSSGFSSALRIRYAHPAMGSLFIEIKSRWVVLSGSEVSQGVEWKWVGSGCWMEVRWIRDESGNEEGQGFKWKWGGLGFWREVRWVGVLNGIEVG